MIKYLVCGIVMMSVEFTWAKSVGISKPLLFEGDIILTKQLANFISHSEKEAAVSNSKRYVIKDNLFHWKDGIVPYNVADNIDDAGRYYIDKSIEELETKTCIRFIKRKDEEDYIDFTDGNGCSSNIGRQGGKQPIIIGEGCLSKGEVLHEILHALGFFHEQSRIDRDFYVKVLWWNVVPDAEKNFATYGHGIVDTFGVPYDKQSLMHYDNVAFTKNGQHTLEAIGNPNEKLGRHDLSDGDIKQIRMLYKCRAHGESGTANCSDKSEKCTIVKKHEKYCQTENKVIRQLCPLSCGIC